MRKFILFMLAFLLCAAPALGANFFWKDSYAGLTGVSAASGDRGVVVDSNGLATFYYYDSSWHAANLTGGLQVLSKADNYTLGSTNAAEAYGSVVFVTADAKTITLPAVVAGMSTCVVVVGGAYDVTVDPNASDGIILTHIANSRDTDGDSITNSSAAAGDFICLVGDSADGWTTMGYGGTWAQN